MKKKTFKNPLNTISIVYFWYARCLQQNIYRRVLSIRVFSADEQYLNNRVFPSRNYQLIIIVALRKFDVLFYLSPITLQFLFFIHWIVLHLFFHRVSVKTIYVYMTSQVICEHNLIVSYTYICTIGRQRYRWCP